MSDRLSTIRLLATEEWTKHIPEPRLVNREVVIAKACEGQMVVHLGAADAPFHEQKWREGTLLHQRVRATAKSIVGIDLDVAAVEWLRKNAGIDDILVADAMEERWSGDLRFDVALCCDIIEHVSNPGSLLDRCRLLLKADGRLVVSTINGTALKAALRAILGKEAVHPEHVAYFSYATLCRLLLRHGFEPIEAGFFCYSAATVLGKLVGAVARLVPACGDGVITIARRRR